MGFREGILERMTFAMGNRDDATEILRLLRMIESLSVSGTGTIAGSFHTVASSPSATTNALKYVLLATQDGTNDPGVYYSDGSTWELKLASSASSLLPLTGWTVVNPTIDRTLDDGAGATVQDLSRVLGTLITDLT